MALFPLLSAAGGEMEFAVGKLQSKKSPRRAIFRPRKGLKRYPFLPAAKKIQA
jgi:hypothetical protein